MNKRQKEKVQFKNKQQKTTCQNGSSPHKQHRVCMEMRKTSLGHLVQMTGTVLCQLEGHLAQVLWRNKARGNI